MRIRWWQSIRWGLMFGSVLLALVATSLLALTAVLVTNYYYGVEQQSNLSAFASSKAVSVGNEIVTKVPNAIYLHDAAVKVIRGKDDPAAQQYLMIVFNRTSIPIYTNFTVPSNQAGKTAFSNLQAQLTASAHQSATNGRETPGPAQATATALRQATVTAAKTIASRRTTNVLLDDSLQFLNPSIQQSDFGKFSTDIQQAIRHAHASDDKFARNSPIGDAQPFAVRPIITSNHTVAGVLVVTTRPEAIPPFVTTVGEGVFVASLAIALLAALAGILFSQTITRPLGRLTQATRVLATGDYSAQVTTDAPGELGELAHNFNAMALQLKQDVTELHKQEVWRRELIMNITHDLATPLTAIAGLGESLMDGVNQSREDYEATGRVIMQETLRLGRLVQDLHVMAKVEAGALQPKLKPVRLATLVDDVLAVQAQEFERHQVEPNNTIPYNLPLVQVDSDMLMRVLSNLCNNALRHTPSGGNVTIEAIAQDNKIVVGFTDTGEGIPPEALPRVFERFYRADSARKSSTGGSGLGLAIVQAIIEAHGGLVWAENVAGAGARITFTLPLQLDGQPLIPEAPTLPLKREGKGVRGARLRKFAAHK